MKISTGLILGFVFLLSACGATPTPTSLPTLTATPSPRPSPTFTSTPAASTTPVPLSCAHDKLLLKALGPGDNQTQYYLVCDDGESFEALGQNPGSAPILSPKRDAIAFTSDYGIMVTDLEGVPVDPIGLQGRVYSVAWSPDGEYVAYVAAGSIVRTIYLKSKAASTYLLPASFKHPHIAGTGTPPEFTSVAWSPTGNRLALATNYSALYLLDIACDDARHACSTQNMRQTTKGVRGGPLSWSPDGSELAAVCYYTTTDGSLTSRLCLIDSGGKILKMFSMPALTPEDSLGLINPVWSPDGKRIAFSDGRHILMLSVDDESIFDLTNKVDIAPDSNPQLVWLP